MVITLEGRSFALKALPSHALSTTSNQRDSIRIDNKIYDNGVRISKMSEFTHDLYIGSDISWSSSMNIYAVVNEEQDQISVTSQEIDTDKVEVVENVTNAYDPLVDHDSYFLLSAFGAYSDDFNNGIIGVTESGEVASILVNTNVTDRDHALPFDDGSKFITKTETIYEIYLSKGVDEDTDNEYYYLSYYRAYAGAWIISKEVPTNVEKAITYLDRPIFLGFEEMIVITSTTSNGNFVTSEIPVPTEEEEA
jgi:hypothetical protein